MVQRRRLNKEVDDELRRYVRGESNFGKEIELALDKSDDLTRELVFFRANGGDYRQAMLRFSISEYRYYRRLRDFRQLLTLMIRKETI